MTGGRFGGDASLERVEEGGDAGRTVAGPREERPGPVGRGPTRRDETPADGRADSDVRGIVCLATAHLAEARPLVNHWGLSRAPGDGCPVFEGDDIWLVVTGQGRVAMAAGVGYLWGRLGAPRGAAWINVGTAGHAQHDPGCVRLANRLRDTATGRVEFPSLTYRRPCPTAAIATVDQPSAEYPAGELVDMEAAAFFEATCRQSTRELVAVLKVVSDNAHTPFSHERVPALLDELLSPLTAVVSQLHEASRAVRRTALAPPHYDDLVAAWRLTVSRRHLLRRQLWRLAALAPEIDVTTAVADARDGREVVARVERLAERVSLARGVRVR
ncbi:MAG: hypothetical protein B7733_21825 [Myxococcales bacterium FL481]|nr:MAG: hypothetical protein B7733_21825 [Myxococcales bacterium FL481]